MPAYTFTARVREDGSLTLPQEAREQLGLQPGDQVSIQIETSAAASRKAPRNPLYDIIGIAGEGPVDGAENHDTYLYGKKAD